MANSEGVLASDDQVKTRFAVSCVASGDTGLQTGRESVGATVGFELFDRLSVEELARAAGPAGAHQAVGPPGPVGQPCPVVIKQGSGGVLFHEACGHGLEADHIAKDVSVFTGRVGELVASPLVTLVDDGTMGPEWGALAIDDEGHPAGRNVLIENGVLTDYMWDWLRARKEGRASSGNGRRESYQHLPMVRMTNTYVLAGTEDPDEIVRQTPHGVYVAQLGGGQVNTATGDFVFGMTEAYLIEDGRITEPLRDANLIGNGPEVLRNIDVVGNDFAMGPPGHVRQAGPGRAGRRRPAHPAGQRPDRRRHGPMSDGLLDAGRRQVAGWARDGEQVEAYVARGRETEVRVYEGEVESLSSAESAGIGIRVVAGHRQGFAYAGSLDPDVVAETLEEARDNAGFAVAGRVGRPGRSRRRGRRPSWTSGATTWPPIPPTSRWPGPWSWSGRSGPATPASAPSRRRSGAMPRWSRPWPPAPGSGPRRGGRRATCRPTPSPGRAPTPRPAAATASGAGPTDLDLDKAAGDAVRAGHPPARCGQAAVGPPDRGVRAARSPPPCWRIIGGTLDGEAVLKGRSLFADRIGEEVSVAGF